MTETATRLQEYALQVAEKAARQAYNEAAQWGAVQVQTGVEKALQVARQGVVEDARRALERLKGAALEDFRKEALPAEVGQILGGLQQTAQMLGDTLLVLGEVVQSLGQLTQELRTARPTSSQPRRRTIERDEHGRMVALVEE